MFAAGGGLLDGLAERLEQALHLPVALARPPHASRCGINTAREGMVFLAAWGLAEMQSQDRAVPRQAGHWMKRLVQTAKRWYDEYF